MNKKIVLILLFVFGITISLKAQQEILWTDTTGAKNVLRKASNKYPLPVQVFGTIPSIDGGFLDSLKNLRGGYLDSLKNLKGGYLDSILYVKKIKWRNFYTLTTGDSIFVDSLNGNFSKLICTYSDTGTVGDGNGIRDSVIIESWCPDIELWSTIGVIGLSTITDYSIISPGNGVVSTYEVALKNADIIRWRLVNTEYISGRTGKISYTAFQ